MGREPWFHVPFHTSSQQPWLARSLIFGVGKWRDETSWKTPVFQLVSSLHLPTGILTDGYRISKTLINGGAKVRRSYASSPFSTYRNATGHEL